MDGNCNKGNKIYSWASVQEIPLVQLPRQVQIVFMMTKVSFEAFTLQSPSLG